MTGKGSATSLASYARALERLWGAYLERAVILSPRDWSLIGEWHERGVPVQVVREAIEALAERRRATPPRGLGALAAAVDESITAIELGRVRTPGMAGVTPEVEETGESSWRRCLERQPPDAASLTTLLRELLDRHAAGEPPEDLDAALDERLREAVPPDLAEGAERDVEASLLPFRDRMPEAALHDTRRRAVVEDLRRRLGLRRLAKARPEPVE